MRKNFVLSTVAEILQGYLQDPQRQVRKNASIDQEQNAHSRIDNYSKRQINSDKGSKIKNVQINCKINFKIFIANSSFWEMFRFLKYCA